MVLHYFIPIETYILFVCVSYRWLMPTQILSTMLGATA